VPSPPLVSVVTPVYNTARYLRECIESVLAQTWPRLEYIVVDNCSTDGSREIASEYAERTGRLRVVSSTRHLAQLDNFNFALRQISPSSTYTKLIAADDWLYPECIERLVGVAGPVESIALVGSFAMTDTWITGIGLPYESTVFAGRDICRRQLLKQGFFFGSPSAVLYRSDLVRAREHFYDPGCLHADTDVAYDLLRDRDFGFVHQVLSYRREQVDSITGRVNDLEPDLLDFLLMLQKYGPQYLTPDEFGLSFRRHELAYCRAYLRGAMGPRRARFLDYHRPALTAAGYRFPASVTARAALLELADLALNPKKTVGRFLAELGKRRSRG
jgi:glycosyltransferase involved in cell wall biosynthesis